MDELKVPVVEASNALHPMAITGQLDGLKVAYVCETEEQAAQLVSQLNKELFWTGWYACGNNIQWTTANDEKKKQIEQEKT